MVEEGHYIDSKETHILGNCKAGVTQIIFMMEDYSRFSLVIEPFYIYWVSQNIVFTAENTKWKVKVTELVVRWERLVVLLHIEFIRTKVVSVELWLVISE